MKIAVEATTKELKHTSKGSAYTGVKIEGGDWVNVYGDHRGKKGHTLDITEPEMYGGTGGTKWAKIEKPQPPGPVPSANNEKENIPEWEMEARPPASPNPPPPNESRRSSTLQQFFIILDMVSLHVKKLEPDSPEARASLTNNVMNQWIEGKII